MKNNICNSNKWVPPLFLHLDTNPVIGHAVVHSVDKTHILDETVDLIWLLFLHILSSNFVVTPRKSLRFTRFIRSYVNRPAVVLTNHCKSLFAWCALFKLPCSIFFAAVCSQWWCICVAEHICCSKFVNSKVDHETSRCQIVVNISNLTVGVKHSISCRTTFSPNLHSVEEEIWKFAHSATLISWFSDFISKTGGFG